MSNRETRLKDLIRGLGFPLVGIARAVEADHFEQYTAWIDADFHGSMEYLADRAEQRRHPNSLLPTVRSVIMVGLDDTTAVNDSRKERWPLAQSLANAGKVARFALGRDYHQAVWRRLDMVLAWLEAECPGSKNRAVSDSAPLLERDFARRAGLGWIGKNTMLINKQRGSYIMLGAVLTDIELEIDTPHAPDHCGSCTACLRDCPTDAFPAPRVLDARRCISYLNIEVKGDIPVEDRPLVGDWLYGCDICQDVCPWNRKLVRPEHFADACQLLLMSRDEFRERFRDSAAMRANRRGVARNAAIVLGNSGNVDALPALETALANPAGEVREAAAWAIDRIRERQSPA